LNRKVRLYVSAAILEEYERVLLYPRFRFEPQEVSRFLAALRRASVTVKPTQTVSRSADDADNRFLECAETAEADFLVTGNKRHFPTRWKGARVVNSRELLGMIGPSFLR
jgi:putative PIN family toxin of toxin-antitoxin system